MLPIVSYSSIVWEHGGGFNPTLHFSDIKKHSHELELKSDQKQTVD